MEMHCVHSDEERDIDGEIQQTTVCYQGVLGLLPPSFPSLSAHVCLTVGRGRNRERERECTAKISKPAAP